MSNKGTNFIYLEDPDATIDDGFYAYILNINEIMSMARKVVEIRCNHISKKPQVIVNKMFDNDSEVISQWLNRDFGKDKLVEQVNLGMVSKLDWIEIRFRVGYYIYKLSKRNNIIAKLSKEENELLCEMLAEEVYDYHEECKSKENPIHSKDDE